MMTSEHSPPTATWKDATSKMLRTVRPLPLSRNLVGVSKVMGRSEKSLDGEWKIL